MEFGKRLVLIFSLLLSQQDFDIINAIYIMRMGLNVHNISFEQVVNNIQNSDILDEGRKQTYFNSFSKYIKLLQIREDRDIKLENIDKLIHLNIKYDAICRERYMKVGTVELNDEIFGITPNPVAVHEVVKNHLANCRQGTQSALTRAEVSGGGRKPWRQKGTGHARQGSTRAPQWTHGGIVFAPKPAITAMY